ncbi:MAG: radical SAM protein [Candidatus Aminicenantes bacterium]
MTLIKSNLQPRPSDKKKILLMLLPFWDPQIPPLGISCVKSFFQEKENGYKIKTIDANIQEAFREIYVKYFDILKKSIPENKRRHLYNIGHQVLRNHAMAHLHYENKKEYMELAKTLIFNTFYIHVHDRVVSELSKIIAGFFIHLRKYLRDLMEKERPAVLGLSVYSDTLPASLLAFKLAKEMYPGMMTVMGGGIFSGELSVDSDNFDFFLKKTPYIDKIIVGEGELLFLQLLRGELPESQRVFTLKDINNKTVDISSTALPDFSDLDLQYYLQMANYTSRSCPFQCSFCVETVYWGKFRKKKPARIVEELIELYKKYGSQLFLMCDSLLNPVITDLAKEFLKSDSAVYWGGYLRAEPQVCDTENTFLWRRGGFYRARLGIESGSQRILNSMKKKISPDQLKTAVSSLARAGTKTTAMFVIGFPGETEADFQKTLDLVEELRDDIYEADCNPFWYFKGGQVDSYQWKEKYKSIPLYTTEHREMLLLQTWLLHCQPSREEKYNRVNRFIAHCSNLGIPNPYSLDKIYNADERWRKLHKNAVPPLIKFQARKNHQQNDHYIEECKTIENLVPARNIQQLDNHWEF